MILTSQFLKLVPSHQSLLPRQVVMIDETGTYFKNCEVKIILNGDKRGRDTYNFIDSGKVKLATKVSRENFLKILKSSLKL